MTDGKLSSMVAVFAIYVGCLLLLSLMGQAAVKTSDGKNLIESASTVNEYNILEIVWKMATFQIKSDYSMISYLLWLINIVFVLAAFLFVRGG